MDVGDLVGGRTPEGAGIDPDRDFVRWLKVLVGRGTPEGEDIGPGRDSIGRCCWFRERDGKPNARGRGYFQLVGKNINTWQGTEADGVLSWNCESVAVSAQLFSINAEEFRS